MFPESASSIPFPRIALAILLNDFDIPEWFKCVVFYHH